MVRRDTGDDCLDFSTYVLVLAELCVDKGLAPLPCRTRRTYLGAADWQACILADYSLG